VVGRAEAKVIQGKLQESPIKSMGWVKEEKERRGDNPSPRFSSK